MQIDVCDICLNGIIRYGGERYRYKTEKFFNGKWHKCDICSDCLEKLRIAAKDRKINSKESEE